MCACVLYSFWHCWILASNWEHLKRTEKATRRYAKFKIELNKSVSNELNHWYVPKILVSARKTL